MVNERSRQFLEESAARFGSSDGHGNQNKSSSFITASNKLDKFMLLYDDAIKRKERSDHIYSKWLDVECTFQPDTIAGKYNETDHIDIDNLVDRLSKPPKAKDYSKIKYLQDDNFDKQTGQPLFHPKVGRPPLIKENASHSSFVDRLYSKAVIKNEANDIQSSQIQRKSTSKTTAQTKSKDVWEQVKVHKHGYAWQCQRWNNSTERPNVFGYQKNNTKHLLSGFEKWKILTKFESSPDQSMDEPSYPNKSSLYFKEKEKKSKFDLDSECKFHPNINKNSQRIASKWRPQGEDVVELLYKSKSDKEAKLNQMRKQKEDDELNDWTFHPQIISNSSFQPAYKRMNYFDTIN